MFHIGVVGHASRAQQARALVKQVTAAFMSVDDGSMGCDDSHDFVLQNLSYMPSTWSVVLEDDAIPVDGFVEQLEQALPLAPSPIVSLYLGRLRPPWAQRGAQSAVEAAEAENADWIVSSHLLHAVGYAIRTDLIPSLLDHLTPLPVDQHISSWAQTHGHTISYAFPSLVDHADGPTIVEHPDQQARTPGRVAYRTAPHTSWSTKTVSLTI